MFKHLRSKILAAFGALILAVLGLVIVRTRTSIQDQALEAILEQTKTTQAIVHRLIQDKQKELESGAEVLVQDIAFREAVATHAQDKDYRSMKLVAQNFMGRLAMEEMMVTDDWGAVLTDVAMTGSGKSAVVSEGAFKPETDVTELVAGVKEAIDQGNQGQHYTKPQLEIAKDGRLLLTVTSNVMSPNLYGVIWSAWALNAQRAKEVKDISQAEISFVNGDQIVSSTLSGRKLEDLRKSLKAHLKKVGAKGRYSSFTVEVAGESFQSTLMNLKDEKNPSAVLIQFSLDVALGPLQSIQRDLLIVGALGVLVAILASLVIAQTITNPIRKLVFGTKEVAKGNLHVRLDIQQKDELGQLSDSFNEMVQGLEEKEKMRNVMNKVVSKEIAEEMLNSGISLGGEEREVTVLFSDIRSFTSLSESLKPDDLVRQLNEYLTSMSREVDKNKGVIDKYIGDAIMALWGAPIAHDDDPDNAVYCGLAMLRALDQLNTERQTRNEPPLRIGVGINTGLVVAGNTGSDERLNYTVLGDEVNLASRVESLTKQYGVQLIVTEKTLQKLRGDFVTRELDKVTVKGKKEPIAIYEILGTGKASASAASPSEMAQAH